MDPTRRDLEQNQWECSARMKSQNTSFPGRILSRITRQAPSVSACLQASHSAQASLHCPALSNRKRIRKNPYLEQGAGPEEGRGGRRRQVLCPVPPLPSCTPGTLVWQAFLWLFSKTQKRWGHGHSSKLQGKRATIPLLFFFPHVLNQLDSKNQH